MKKISFLLAVLGLFSFIIWSSPSRAQEVRLMIGSTGTASSHYAYWVAVGEAIKKYASGINPTVIETGGALDNADRIIRKQIDIGLTNRAAAYESYFGKNKWEGKPNSQLRWLWNYVDSPMVFFVREDSGINSLRDLNGKKFCAGARGSGVEKLVGLVFEILNIKPDYYRGDYNAAASAVEDRRIVGMAKWSATDLIGDAVVIRLATETKLKFLSFSEEDLKKVMTELPYVGRGYHPPGVYKGQNYPVLSIGSNGGSLSNTDLSPDLVYKICKAVWQGWDLQQQAYTGIKGKEKLSLFKGSVENSPIPLHAGTIKMCKELAIEVPKNLIPTEYK